VPVWQLDGARGLRALSRVERWGVAVVGLVTGIGLHQWMPAVVGIVAGTRAVGAGSHPTGDRRMFVLFALLILAHGLLATLPGPHLGPRTS